MHWLYSWRDLYFFSLTHSVYAQLLDRPQNKMQMILIPADSFISSEGATDDEKIKDLSHGSSAASADIQVIYEDTSSIWINVSVIKEGARN